MVCQKEDERMLKHYFHTYNYKLQGLALFVTSPFVVIVCTVKKRKRKGNQII